MSPLESKSRGARRVPRFVDVVVAGCFADFIVYTGYAGRDYVTVYNVG